MDNIFLENQQYNSFRETPPTNTHTHTQQDKKMQYRQINKLPINFSSLLTRLILNHLVKHPFGNQNLG